jgi:uncharacterized protein
MIIDFHCHAGPGDKMTAPWNTSAPIENYLRRARAAGIDKTVVMPPLHGNYQQANAQVAQIVARYPARLIGFAFVHARRDAGRIFRMIQHAVTKWRFRGMKVHGFEAMPTREVCDTALAFNLPVLVDIVSRPEVVDMFAREFPRVNFIIAHLGSFTDNWNAHQQVIYQLARYPNVYADTSGVRQFDYLLQAVRRGGSHKLLFGSDGPWLHPGMELFKIRLLGLPAEQEALVLGRNAVRLLRRARIDENSQVSFSQEAKRIQSLWSGVNSAQSELRYESDPVASEYRL